MTIDRRTLIARSCMTAAALAARPSWAAAGIFREGRAAGRAAAADTVLVVVDLNGGNDGLNTVVPFADPAYRAARGRVGLTGSQLLPIDARTGLHPSLAHLHDHLEAGGWRSCREWDTPAPTCRIFGPTTLGDRRAGTRASGAPRLARPGSRSALPPGLRRPARRGHQRRHSVAARSVRDDADHRRRELLRLSPRQSGQNGGAQGHVRGDGRGQSRLRRPHGKVRCPTRR